MVDVRAIFDVITMIPLLILFLIRIGLIYAFNGILYAIYYVTWKVFKKWPDVPKLTEEMDIFGDPIWWDARMLMKSDRTLFYCMAEKDWDYAEFWEAVHYKLFHKRLGINHYVR